MRHATLYEAPFRVRRRPAGQPEPDYGPNLTQEIVLRPGGPLYDQGPGDISRWMALPWQGDTAFCRSGYEADYDPYLPTFWPARVPNQVLTEEDYKIVVNTSLPRAERMAAYNRREQWLRALTGKPPDQMMQMIAEFGKMGIVEERVGVPNDPDLPAVMLVESLPAMQVQRLAALAVQRFGPAPRRRKTRLERAGVFWLTPRSKPPLRTWSRNPMLSSTAGRGKTQPLQGLNAHWARVPRVRRTLGYWTQSLRDWSLGDSRWLAMRLGSLSEDPQDQARPQRIKRNRTFASECSRRKTTRTGFRRRWRPDDRGCPRARPTADSRAIRTSMGEAPSRGR